MTAPYHLALGGADVTMSAEQIRAAYVERSITLETKVWRDGLEEWMPLADLAPELRLHVTPVAAAPAEARLQDHRGAARPDALEVQRAPANIDELATVDQHRRGARARIHVLRAFRAVQQALKPCSSADSGHGN